MGLNGEKMNLTYDEIRELSETEAAKMAIEHVDIKGYNVYFIRFDAPRGFSYLVYKNGHQIIDDFANIHAHTLKEEGLTGLRKLYINSISNKLYTEEELAEPIKSYDDYNSKSYFLRNYYHKSMDHISMFRIFGDDEEADRKFEEKVKTMLKNPVGFCYMEKGNEDFIKHQVKLLKDLNAQKVNAANNYEYQKSAFLYEMYNHEYAINWQADWDVLSVFGNVTYQRVNERLDKYFDELKFTDVQRKAYMDARKEYFANQEVA